jgi:hypothetical protein
MSLKVLISFTRHQLIFELDVKGPVQRSHLPGNERQMEKIMDVARSGHGHGDKDQDQNNSSSSLFGLMKLINSLKIIIIIIIIFKPNKRLKKYYEVGIDLICWNITNIR